jgi:hypothetical protein
MFVNGIGFLVTLSRPIRLGTVEAIRSRKQDVLSAVQKRLVNLHVYCVRSTGCAAAALVDKWGEHVE